MKRKEILMLVFVSFFYFLFLRTTAYANSSWHWLTKSNPFDLLPYAVILTLLIEYVIIQQLNSIKNYFRLFIVICFANMASFLLPYATLLLPSAVGYTLEKSIYSLPIYIVGFGYLFLTLIAEIPIVYGCCKNIVTSEKRLLISIILVNTITTAMVAAAERIIYRGMWI